MQYIKLVQLASVSLMNMDQIIYQMGTGKYVFRSSILYADNYNNQVGNVTINALFLVSFSPYIYLPIIDSNSHCILRDVFENIKSQAEDYNADGSQISYFITHIYLLIG